MLKKKKIILSEVVSKFCFGNRQGVHFYRNLYKKHLPKSHSWLLEELRGSPQSPDPKAGMRAISTRTERGAERAGSASVKVLWSLLTVSVSATLRGALLRPLPFSACKLLGLFQTFLLNYYHTVLGLFLFHLEAFL